MFGEVDASFMVPSTSSCQHGPPSLIRVRSSAVPRPRRYFAAPRLPCSIGCRSGSPRRQPTTGRVLVLIRPHAHPPARGARRWVSRRRSHTGLSRGDSGPPRVNWAVLLRACPGQTPPGRPDASPLPSWRWPCCLRWLKGPSAPGISALSRPLSRSPHVCAPTHHPPGLPRTAQGSLPACRAQLWPGGVGTRWTTYRIPERNTLLSFQRTSIAWSHLSTG